MTPEQEERVRRALAALGREGPDGSPPMPPEVAARLDGVLTELTASRTEPDELAARRRRRWPHVLVAAAAAAIVVGGLAGLLRGTTTNGSSDSASSARAPAASAARPAGGSSASPATPTPAPSFAEGALAVPELHTATIDRDIRRVAQTPAAVAPRHQPMRAQAPRSPAVGGCAVPEARPGDQLVAVRLDGQPAVLLISPVKGGSRTARVYACASPGHPVATTTVPAQ